MNIENAFSFMEQIHRYLMVPRVIVFMALDIVQFTYICQKHFAKLSLSQQDLQNQDWKNYIAAVTQNYVDKIFPAENRIYLPGIKNENREVLVKGYRGSGETGDENSEDPREIKWIILYKIYRRTGIICDAHGRKKHYYEPDTLRKVVSFVDYLNMMEPVLGNDLSPGEEWECLQENMDSIYKDIVERMENEKLLIEKRVLFDNIRRQHVTRQARSAWELLKELLEEQMDVGTFIRISEKEMYERRIGFPKYTFGDYIFLLYRYSRKKEKSLIRLLLALQTANMTHLYNNLRINRELLDYEEKTEIEDMLIDFRQIFDNSITGEWFKRMINHVADVRLVDQNELKMCTIPIKDIQNTNELVDKVHAVCMLYPNEKSIEIRRNNYTYEICVENLTNTFDAWGFVIEALDYGNHIKRVRDILNFKKENYKETALKNIDCKTEIDRVEKAYLEWVKKYGGFAIPVYSVDIYYNLLKRLYENKDQNWSKSETEWKNVEFVENEGVSEEGMEIFKAYIRVLNRVSVELKRQDSYYNEKQDDKLLKLEETFNSCPFIKWVKGKNEEHSFIRKAVREILKTYFMENSKGTSKDNQNVTSGNQTIIKLENRNRKKVNASKKSKTKGVQNSSTRTVDSKENSKDDQNGGNRNGMSGDRVGTKTGGKSRKKVSKPKAVRTSSPETVGTEGNISTSPENTDSTGSLDSAQKK